MIVLTFAFHDILWYKIMKRHQPCCFQINILVVIFANYAIWDDFSGDIQWLKNNYSIPKAEGGEGGKQLGSRMHKSDICRKPCNRPYPSGQNPTIDPTRPKKSHYIQCLKGRIVYRSLRCQKPPPRPTHIFSCFIAFLCDIGSIVALFCTKSSVRTLKC